MIRPFDPWPFWHDRYDVPDEFLTENRDLQRPRSREELWQLDNRGLFW